jgi:hypothetical protein
VFSTNIEEKKERQEEEEKLSWHTSSNQMND